MSIGLDIGSKTIKVVELNRSAGKYNLKSAGVIGYTSNINLENITDDKQLSSLAQTIKKLFKDAKISSNKTAVAIPETQSFTRLMKFPLLNDQEIDSAVKWEAEEYIPIPVKEAIIEHQILERRETSTPPQVLVLLIAVRKDVVEKYIKLLQFVDISVVGVETELMALARSLAPPDKTVLIVDFGAHSTDIAVVKKEQLIFSRSVPTAGDAFSRAVAQSIGVSPEQAEEYKKTYGLSPGQLEGKVSHSLAPVIKVIIEEIKKTLHYYQLEVKSDPPTSIILSGGSSGLPGISTTFTQLLGLEVGVGNPFQKISVDPASAKKLANFAPLYAVAAGLAMRED
jgi:type IV pilus assembly protein PilM